MFFHLSQVKCILILSKVLSDKFKRYRGVSQPDLMNEFMAWSFESNPQMQEVPRLGYPPLLYVSDAFQANASAGDLGHMLDSVSPQWVRPEVRHRSGNSQILCAVVF